MHSCFPLGALQDSGESLRGSLDALLKRMAWNEHQELVEALPSEIAERFFAAAEHQVNLYFMPLL